MNYLFDACGYWLSGVIVAFIYVCLYTLIGKFERKRIIPLKILSTFIFGLYLITIFSVTVSPMYGFHPYVDWSNVNLIPFQMIKEVKGNPLNFFGNIFMFIPMGFFPLMMSKKYFKINRTIFLGFSFSLIIEVLQLFLGRGTDVDDLMLNTFGTLLGYVFTVVIVNKNTTIRKKITRSKRVSVILYGFIMLITVLIVGSVKRYQYLGDYLSDYRNEKEVNTDHENIKEISTEEPQNEVKQLEMTIEAENACIINADNGDILYDKNKDTKVAPASTTKMITALVVMDYCSMEDVVKVGNEINEVTQDASRAGLYGGDELSVRNLLYGLLLPSGNDAAYVLAAYTGRMLAETYDIPTKEAISLFVGKMNEKAKELGADHTNFVRPDGYDATGQYSTAYDLAIIAKELQKNQVLADIVKTIEWNCVYEDGRHLFYQNTNLLLNPENPYYNENIIGMKTGSSAEAGNCLVSEIKINDNQYICVVLKDSEEGRYQDTTNMIDLLKDL